MNIIFLDIDGVLNNINAIKNPSYCLDDNCIKRLKTILDKTNAKIVLSSSWRLRKDMHLLLLAQKITDLGINLDLIIDATPQMTNRTEEILDWVENNKVSLNINKWIAIDDTPLNLDKNKFVKKDFKTGLIDEDVIKSINLLI